MRKLVIRFMRLFSQANYMQMLPYMAKFSELCENRDQFHWIKNAMTRLQESVSMDNVLSHQVIFDH